MAGKTKKVSIYSTPTCTYCNMAKSFFRENKVAYEEFDVASDLEKRKEMIEISGQMGVPVIKIGSDILVGFQEELMREKLGL